MIIYGWGHFNRRQHSLIRSGCDSCGHRGYKRSFTSSRFISLYFIPIIPIGKQKIVSECPNCKNALGLSYGKWKKLKKCDLADAISNYSSNPTDTEAAEKLLALVVSTQDRETLRNVAPQIRAAFKQNEQILSMLANVYSYLCMDAEADDVFLEVVSLSDSEEIAADADAHMKLQGQKKPKSPNRLLQSLPVLIVPTILILLFGSYLGKALSSHVEDAYLVSGLDHSYDAVLNGESVTLSPRGRLKTKLIKYGENELSLSSGSTFTNPVSFTIEESWQSRASGGPTVVVNPDKAAVLLWERTPYSVSNVSEANYEFDIAVGEYIHKYYDVDYAFKDFPETVDLPTSSSVVYKVGLSYLDEHSPTEIVEVLLNNDLSDKLQDYLKAILHGASDDDSLIFFGSNFLPQEEFLAIAQSRLGERPVRIEWHRSYQNLMQTPSTSADLEKRYKEYFENDPDDSAIAYLYGRIIENPEKSKSIFERAARLPNPTGYASNAIAYHLILEGEFGEALEYSDRALQIIPQNDQFKHMRRTALYGVGDYVSIESDIKKGPDRNELDYRAFFEWVYCLAKNGKKESAQTEISNYLSAIRVNSETDESDLAIGRAYLESAFSVAAMDEKSYVASVSKIDLPSWSFQTAIIQGDLKLASSIVSDPEFDASIPDLLTLYTLLSRSENSSLARPHLESAVEKLSQGKGDELRWAAWLKGEGAPDTDMAAHTCYDITNHSIYLAALAQRYPARSREYLARAAAIHAKNSFHTLALRDLLSTKSR